MLKGMTPEETNEFAMKYYYGPAIYVSESSTIIYDTEADDIVKLYSVYDSDEELPFK